MRIQAWLQTASMVGLCASSLAVQAQNGPPAQTGQPATSVTVVNTPTNAVPVTGNVGVTGTVSVNNASSNPVPVTGAVTISGAPSVTVSNLQNLAVERGRTPYQKFGFANVCPNAFFCYVAFPPVPAGMRLVATHVSGSVTLLAPNNGAEVGLSAAPPFDSLDIPAQAIGPNRYLGSSPVTFYFEPGQTPHVMVSGSVISANNSRPVSLIGYLVSTQ